jgi:biopolymer transport protein ExbD
MPKIQPATGASPGRLGRTRRVATSLAEINVVPLVDVMLVLLIIFMITAPMIQRGVDVNLPIARRATQIEGQPVYVTIPGDFPRDHLVYLGDERIRLDALQERVRQKMENVSDKQVFLRGDGNVQYRDLMDVFDRLRGAGVTKLGLVAKAPGER